MPADPGLLKNTEQDKFPFTEEKKNQKPRDTRRLKHVKTIRDQDVGCKDSGNIQKHAPPVINT